MNYVGIDTVRFYKEFTQDEINKIIRPRLHNDNKIGWFGNFMVFPHTHSQTKFSFQGSIASFVNGDSNLSLATPDQIAKAIEMFKLKFGLDISDAHISRLDIAMNFAMNRPITDYQRLFKSRKHYELIEKESTRYLNSGSNERVIVLYDKIEEMRAKQKFDQYEPISKHLLRIEFRICGHVARDLKIIPEMRPFTLTSLSQSSGFRAAIEAFERRTLGVINLRKFGKSKYKRLNSKSNLYKLTGDVIGSNPKSKDDLYLYLQARNLSESEIAKEMKYYAEIETESLGFQLYQDILRTTNTIYEQHRAAERIFETKKMLETRQKEWKEQHYYPYVTDAQ